MIKINKKLAVVVTAFMAIGFGAFTTQANAQEVEWTARTVEQVKADLVTEGNGSVMYTVQWGDTLSVIAAATGVPVEKLVEMNNINNANLIFSGTQFQLSKDATEITVKKGEEQKTYDVSGEAVKEVEKSSATSGYELTVEATAYSYNEAGLTPYTADGTYLPSEPNVIAVDPSVIPLGSIVEIPGYGTFRAADTGGAIKGNRIDVHFVNVGDTYNFGRRTITIRVVR